MKIKLLGITVFEIQKDSPLVNNHAAERPATAPEPAQRSLQNSSPTVLDLNGPDSVLPRTRRRTIDLAASLKACGIEDPGTLWQHKFKAGTAGGTLKVLLGARGRKPGARLLDQTKRDLRHYPGSALPLLPGTNKVDIEASLAMFNIQDSSVLWRHRYAPNSAGGRLKMLLRAKGRGPSSAGNSELASVPETANASTSPTGVDPATSRALPLGSESETPPLGQISPGLNDSPQADGVTRCGARPHQTLKRDERGRIDIEASLKALGIHDPLQLWRRQIQPGSPEHELQKAIASALAQRQSVPGITREDIGLTA